MISAEEIVFIFCNSEYIIKGWKDFYMKFTNSACEIFFSIIGYNKKKTQAIVEMGNTYASLGGEGSLIFLKLDNNEWKIVKAVHTWIS
jgi:hypothetical protein